MKLIRTMVRANRVDDVRGSVGRLQIASITVTELRDSGHQKKAAWMPLGNGFNAPEVSNALIELVVRDEVVAEVIVAITRAARTEDIGDGHVSVFPLDHESDLLAHGRDVV